MRRVNKRSVFKVGERVPTSEISVNVYQIQFYSRDGKRSTPLNQLNGLKKFGV